MLDVTHLGMVTWSLLMSLVTMSHLLGHQDTLRLGSEAGHQGGLVATHIMGSQVTMLLRLVNH